MEDSDVSENLTLVSSEVMDAILDGHAATAAPKEERRLPGYSQVKRKMDDVFDLAVYKKIAIQFYNAQK